MLFFFSVKVSNVLNTLTLKQIFWKTKTFFKNLEYRFLVETTKIENTPFQFKTALSEANVKTNSMVTTKWTYHKEWSFASKYVWKICSSFRKKVLIWCTNDPNVHIHIFRKCWSLILGCFFPVSILKIPSWFSFRFGLFVIISLTCTLPAWLIALTLYVYFHSYQFFVRI